MKTLKAAATFSILTADLDRLDPDRRVERLTSMKYAARAAITRQRLALAVVDIKTDGAVTSVIAYTR